MSSEEICSALKLMLPSTKIEEEIAKDELKFRIDVMKAENHHLQTNYENERIHLIKLMKCDDYKNQQNFFKKEFKKLIDYLDNLKQDVIVIKEQYKFHGEKLSLAFQNNEEFSSLLKIAKEEEKKINKFQLENKAGVETETLNEIHHQMNSIETQIFSLENILIEKKCKNSEYENFNIELKADENKNDEKEKVKIVTEEVNCLKNVKAKKQIEHKNEEQKIKLQIDNFNLKIVERTKYQKKLKEFEEILKTMEEQKKSKLDDRQRRQTEQTEELLKLEKPLKISKEKLENFERNHQELCKINNLHYINFKNANELKIQEILLECEKNNSEKNIVVEEMEKNLENLHKCNKENYCEKRKKIEERENIFKLNKEKIDEDKRILEELRQKKMVVENKIAIEIQEKEKNLQLKENANTMKNELKIKIEELNNELYQEMEKISLLENMKKDSLEVAQHVDDALENRKNLIAEEAEFKEEIKEKLKFIENRNVEETRNFHDKTLAFETEISQNAKQIAQMKREMKKRDDREMKKERLLREKIVKLQEEIKKMKISNMEKKSVYEFNEMETDDLLEEAKAESLKSILKPLSMKKLETPTLDVKSSRKVQFDIESDESSLSQFPLTQKQQSP